MSQDHQGSSAKTPIPTEIVARLEAASVGSREIDGLLARHFCWHRVEPRHMRGSAGGWIAPEDFIGLNGDGSPKLDGLHGTSIYRDPPRLTQSIDAALALADRVLPGGYWRVHRLPPLEAVYAPYWATFGPAGGQEAATGNTAPLALCIAILKARTAAEADAVGRSEATAQNTTANSEGGE